MTKRLRTHTRHGGGAGKDSDDDGYLCDYIQKHIKQERNENRKLTLHQSLCPAVTATIWSRRKSDIDHNFVWHCLVEIVQWIRGMKWSRYEPNERWSYRIDATDYQKRWCSDEKTLTRCHVNSGETLRRHGESVHVRVIRTEDLIKVLIHETLHAHQWDRLVRDARPQAFEYETETLVESTARILFCQWLCFSSLSPIRNQQSWMGLLERELEWMKHHTRFFSANQWSAETHVLAYYLATAAVLHQWQKFWSWLWNSNTSDEALQTWPALRDQAWKSYYGPSAQTLLSTWKKSGSRILAPSKSTNTCTSLNMVHHQVSLRTPDCRGWEKRHRTDLSLPLVVAPDRAGGSPIQRRRWTKVRQGETQWIISRRDHDRLDIRSSSSHPIVSTEHLRLWEGQCVRLKGPCSYYHRG